MSRSPQELMEEIPAEARASVGDPGRVTLSPRTIRRCRRSVDQEIRNLCRATSVPCSRSISNLATQDPDAAFELAAGMSG